jgi:DNA-directed RNA polymerase specialized sigma24 family protein
MQPDDVILPIAHKWSKILWSPGFDYDELVAVAYCYLKPQPADTKPWILHCWARHTITQFISAGGLRHRPYQGRDLSLRSITEPRRLIPFTKSELDDVIDIKDAIQNLSNLEAEIIYMRFWRDMEVTEIAKALGKGRGWVRYSLKRILGILKERVLR